MFNEKSHLLDEVVGIVTDQGKFADRAHLLEVMSELPSVNEKANRGETGCIAVRNYLFHQSRSPDPGISQRARYLYGAVIAGNTRRR